jgi:hypothetical protein
MIDPCLMLLLELFAGYVAIVFGMRGLLVGKMPLTRCKDLKERTAKWMGVVCIILGLALTVCALFLPQRSPF